MKAGVLASQTVPVLVRAKRDMEHVDFDAHAKGVTYELLGFHGTPSRNIEGIVSGGFRPGKGGTHGGAIYLSSSAKYSNIYVYQASGKGKRRMLGCRALAFDQERWRQQGDISVIDPSRVLPVCILEYARKQEHARQHGGH
jgi:hypothetical protein